MKQFLRGIALATILVFAFVSMVLATPSSVTNLSANPTDTSMIISWTMAASSNSTVVRYRTDTYPSSPTNGTLSYNGTGNQVTVSGLTAGTVYYFSAWGYDGSDYSPTPAQLVMNTTTVAILTGAAITYTSPVPISSVTANANQAPAVGAFNLEPFTSIINHFNNAQGGLGIPTANLWEIFAIGFIVFGGMSTYIKMKNFFVAYFVVVFLSVIFVGLHLVQGYLVAAEIIIGLGVWAIEKYYQ